MIAQNETKFKEERCTKKNNEFHELTVRFDNAPLAEKLSAMYAEEKYSSKNRLIMDLLSDGIDARTKAEQQRKKLDTIYASLGERQSEYEARRAEFERTVYEQLRHLQREYTVTKNALGIVCNLLEAIYFNYSITQAELNSGFYDYLPARFERSA